MLRLALALVLATAGCAGPAAPPEASGEGAPRLLVLNKEGASAWLVDPASGEVLREMPTGDGPHEAVVLADGRTAVVTDYGQRTPGATLTVLDLARGERVRTVDLDTLTRPHGIVALGPDRVLVTSETQRALAEVDVARGEVMGVYPTDGAGSHMVALAPGASGGAGVAFTANIGSGDLSRVDLARGRVAAQTEVGAVAEAVAVSPDGHEVWAASLETGAVIAYSAGTLEERARAVVPGRPIRLTFTPDGKRVLVTGVASGALTVLDAETLAVLGSVELGGGSAPVGTAVSPGGARAWVSLTARDEVVEVDLDAYNVVRRFAAGRVPDGLAVVPG